MKARILLITLAMVFATSATAGPKSKAGGIGLSWPKPTDDSFIKIKTGPVAGGVGLGQESFIKIKTGGLAGVGL